jgi:hypothetical protein
MMAEQDAPDALLEQALSAAESDGVTAALAVIAHADDALAMIRRHGKLAAFFYRKQKDVTSMIIAGETGIRLGLAAAQTAQNPTKIQTAVKILAYNVGANCWPGWDDPGISITPADIAAGLRIAEQSRRLVESLDLGAEQTGHAEWLAGALKLAAGERDEAGAAFDQAVRAFKSAGLPAEAAMSAGYKALAGGRAEDLAEALAALRALATEDGDFYAAQLQTAQRIFVPG